ncbi:MAG TPA: chemotaxis protein CheW, partial [Bacteroidales bacterium]|nr:chemotaxis protein CheW [Bacteroidales bacterium]
MARDPRELLQKRAHMIARRPAETEGASNTIMVVEFLLSPEWYAIDTSFVTEVLPLGNLTSLPGTPPFVVGIMNLRGKIISILN